MALSTADAARLVALLAARDKLAMGTAIAEIEYNGERRAFTKADSATLDRLINQLQCGGAYGTVRVRM